MATREGALITGPELVAAAKGADGGPPVALVRVLVVSHVRFYRDALELLLPGHGAIQIVATTGSVGDAVAVSSPEQVVIVVDAALPDGPSAVPRLRKAFPGGVVVAVAVGYDADPVREWAEAGVSGFVAKDQSLDDIARVVESVAAGEALCDGRIVATLLRCFSARSRDDASEHDAGLTPREREVAALLGEGYSNKEIASRLSIELPTVKNHVHAVLRKLAVHRRAEIPARLLRD